MLLREIEESFSEARIIRLEVEPANAAAVAFYTANGFVEVGNTANCGSTSSGIPAKIYEKALSQRAVNYVTGHQHSTKRYTSSMIASLYK